MIVFPPLKHLSLMQSNDLNCRHSSSFFEEYSNNCTRVFHHLPINISGIKKVNVLNASLACRSGAFSLRVSNLMHFCYQQLFFDSLKQQVFGFAKK